jgi:hypothetical protein
MASVCAGQKANLQTSTVWALGSFKYAFDTPFNEDQLRIALATADSVTSSYTAVKSYVQ